MADRIGMAQGNVGRVISAQTGAAHRHPVAGTFAARQVKHIVDDHLVVSVMRPHSVGRMNALVIKTLQVNRIRTVNRAAPGLDVPRDRIDQMKVSVLIISAERRRE